ncbi:hypothetical protein AB6A40_003272 [Gnathostoma spinigerum]|uniref:Uncharacterized protein n=1 Tax=Gnathostoma spinigerum TaxID=75299 RepID=A0ABD6E978_9BILA
MLNILFVIGFVLFAAVLVRLLFLDRCFIDNISSKVILVTGCRAGFGRAFVEKCLKEGMTVFAACRTQSGANQLVSDFANLPGKLIAFSMDVTSDEDVERARLMVRDYLDSCGKDLHAIVNNAGIAGKLFVDEGQTIDDYKRPVEVNAYGVMRVTKAFKSMLKRAKGRIVTCTSCVVRFPAPTMGPYVVSKWAITGYMEVLRHELYPFGVSVIIVQPGMFQTPMTDLIDVERKIDAHWTNLDMEIKEELGEDTVEAGKRFHRFVVGNSPSDLSSVVNTYFHAICARYPYKQYMCGMDAYVIYRPFSFLPVAVQELVIAGIKWIWRIPPPAALRQKLQ